MLIASSSLIAGAPPEPACDRLLVLRGLARRQPVQPAQLPLEPARADRHREVDQQQREEDQVGSGDVAGVVGSVSVI